MELHKYRFKVALDEVRYGYWREEPLNIRSLRAKGYYDQVYYLKEIFLEDIDFPDRKVMRKVQPCDALYRPIGPYKWKEIEVDWRKTIYNIKVKRIKHAKPTWYSPRYLVSFSVKLTSKEAYELGVTLEGRHYKVTYKPIGNTQN